MMPPPAPLDPTRWTLVRSLFEEAADRPRAEREAFLTAACEGDAELRAEVDSLLVAHDDDTPFLDDALATAAWRLLDEPEAEQVGLRVGPYKLIREVGRGGMGLVYLAERDDGQFEQRVAVKLVRQGHLRGDLVRRFGHERRVLAALHHRSIARLLDGGVTDPLPGAPDGLPYLVMEYVEGEPIKAYCDRHRLGVRARLSLFREVCAAVQYAHQNLVVHRDLKPSNILVAEGEAGSGKSQGADPSFHFPYPSSPHVKLLDFGIAKLVGPEEADGVLTARTGPAALTPTYAAPEQVRGGAATPAADVYALGVLLFELLAGERPYSVAGLSAAEAERVVCETVPPRVSSVAPEERRRALRGDLDTIVATALRKDPTRRYALAADLDEDLRRHLEQLPIRARPATLAYRASRFVRRHAVGVGATVLLVLTLLGGLVSTARQARIAESRTREVQQLAGTLLFEVHDAIRDLPGATRARETLVSNALAYLDALWQDHPEDPRLQRDLADAYAQIAQIQGHPYTTNLGDLDGAERSYRRALDLRLALWARDSTDDDLRRDLAVTYRDLSAVVGWTGDEEAAPLRERAMALFAPLLARGDPDPGVLHDAARLRAEHGWAAIFDSRYEEGLADVDAAIAVLEQVADDRPDDLQLHIDLWRAYSYRADGLSFSGRQDALLVLMETRGLPLLHRLLERHPNHSRLLYGLHIGHTYVGSALDGLGRPREALEARETSLRYAEAMLAVDTTDQKSQEAVGRALSALAQSHTSAGETDEAVRLYGRAIALAQERYDEDPTNAEAGNRLSLGYRFLCRVLAGAGRYAEALRACEPSIEIQERVVERHQAGVLVGNLGSAYGHTARIHRAMAERAATAPSRRRHRAEALRYYALGVETLEKVEAAKAGESANWEVHPESLRVELAALRGGG